MTPTFRCYRDDAYGADYRAIRAFLFRVGDYNYCFARWDWMVSHSCLEKEGLPRIGIWEDQGKIVALATYDCALGSAYLLTAAGHEHLRRSMLPYAEDALAKDGKFRVLIRDGDMAFQQLAAEHGYFPTQRGERDSVFPIAAQSTDYTLPEGFSIVSMAERPDYYQYGRVLWKGFNHEADGEGPFSPTDDDLAACKKDFERPNVNMTLKIAAVAPDGNFVSYCGMWQDADSAFALVEPVATDPVYRKLGLGRAAVLEGIKRCGALGAKAAFVGSSQQFYYAIGFRPYSTSTWWSRNRD